MNTLVVKNTSHTGMKETRAKIMIISLAGFDVGCFKVSFKDEERSTKQLFSCFLAANLEK